MTVNMADPLSVAGLALSVVDVACKLHHYISTARGAKAEIRRLSLELFALKGALDHFDVLKASAPNLAGMLRLTHDTLRSIEKRLEEPTSAVGKVVRSLTWPLKSAEVDKYVAALERSKTFFVMVIMQDTSDSTAAVLSEMKNLTAIIHDDIAMRKADRVVTETDELLRWVAPSNTVEEHAKASRGRVPGTGQWFIDKTFEAWCDTSSDAPPILWITGKCESKAECRGVSRRG
jgi:hypothetical protein